MRYVIVHEDADGEELERGEPFKKEGDSNHYAARLLRTINFFPGDALRVVQLPKKEKRRG